MAVSWCAWCVWIDVHLLGHAAAVTRCNTRLVLTLATRSTLPLWVTDVTAADRHLSPATQHQVAQSY